VFSRAVGCWPVQQHAQRVHVGRDRHLAALHLLGRGVVRRECVASELRERRAVRGLGAIVEELRDAEVDELHLPVLRHEDVRGLQVAVQDELRVRVGHGLEHGEEEPHPRRSVESALPAPGGDRLALDELEHEVGLP
jgi:hypothetical protein